MGQKITEYPQVDYWVKLTREADKKGATLPHRDSADKREVEKFGDMQRARYRSSFSVLLPASMEQMEQQVEKQYDPDDDGDEVAADDAPGALEDDEDDEEAADDAEEGAEDGDTAGA